MQGKSQPVVWILGCVGCFWLWLLFSGDWNRIEWIAAACGALVAATFAELARRLARTEVRVPFERLRAAVGAPVTVFADFGLITYALARSLLDRKVVRGRYLAREFDPGPKTTPGGMARRAWTVILGGYSPNAYVVDIDLETKLVLVHDLVPWRKSEEPA